MKKNLKKLLTTRAFALIMALANAIMVIKVANAYGVSADFLGCRLVALATIAVVIGISAKALKAVAAKGSSFIKAAAELADMKYKNMQ